MSSTLSPPSLSILPRCPSPIVPGAWPQSVATTPVHLRHERSSTYPPPSRPGSVPPTAPLHLDRVTSFHQRLSLSLSNSSDATSSGLPPSASSAPGGVFTPSYSLPGSILSNDESDLTRFTPHNTRNSLLQSADTSISTTYTADSVSDRPLPFRAHGSKASHDKLPNDNESQDRIYPDEHLSITFADRPKTMNDDSTPPPKSATENRSSRPERPRIILPDCIMPTGPSTPGSPGSFLSLTSIPTSPIVFASPTSSRQARSPLQSHSILHDTSDGVFDSFGSSPSPPSSPSPVSQELSAAGRRPMSLSPSEPLMEDRSGGMNMFTTLSLPSTLHSTGPDSEHEAMVLDRSWTRSPSLQSSSSPASVPSTYEQLQSDYYEDDPRTLSPIFPSIPALTVSPIPLPALQAMGSSPSPTETCSLHAPLVTSLERLSEDPGPTGATEYAEALMSSAWGSGSIIQVMGVGPTAGTAPVDPENVIVEEDISGERPQFEGVPLEYLSKGTSTRKGVIEKIKRFGGKVKRFWRRSCDRKWRDLAIVRDIGRRSIAVTMDVNVDTSAGFLVGNPTVTPAATSTDMVSPRNSHGFNVRLRSRRPRPSLNEHTYSTSIAPIGHDSAPETNASPLPDLVHVPNAQDQVNGEARSETHTDSECQTQKVPVSVQKSHRPSSSVITDLGHSSSAITRPRPLSSVVSMNRHIPVMNIPRRTYCGPVNVEIEGLNSVIPQVNTEIERICGPPGLLVPTSSHSVIGRTELRVPHLTDSQVEGAQNQTRRFSLSALSNLTNWKDSSSVPGVRKRGSCRSATTQS